VTEKFERDGLTLWYGAAETPALAGSNGLGVDLAVTVGIRPVDASNRITIDYRVNGGPVQTLAAEWLWTAVADRAQYFRARFPRFQPGDTVAYVAICRCAGRQVPSADQAKQLPSSFRIATVPAQSVSSNRARVPMTSPGQFACAGTRSPSRQRTERTVVVPARPERTSAGPAIAGSLTVAFSHLPDIASGKPATIVVTGTTRAEGVIVTDVDLALARPGPGGRTIVYVNAVPSSGDWRAWQATLNVPALPAGDYPLFADAYGKDGTGKPCYRRASVAIRSKEQG
jgi:hypothetical protein